MFLGCLDTWGVIWDLSVKHFSLPKLPLWTFSVLELHHFGGEEVTPCDWDGCPSMSLPIWGGELMQTSLKKDNKLEVDSLVQFLEKYRPILDLISGTLLCTTLGLGNFLLYLIFELSFKIFYAFSLCIFLDLLFFPCKIISYPFQLHYSIYHFTLWHFFAFVCIPL